jgi:phosphate transport system substrate-binding protein
MVLPLLLFLSACGDGAAPSPTQEGANAPSAPGLIRVDGSSTVFPITEAVAEEFRKAGNNAQVTVGISGTGGGFKKFCAGETDLSDASRPIKPSEVELCVKNGIGYVELPVAYDGIAIIANPANSWANDITAEELKKIWEPEAQGKVTKWSQVRAGWPDKDLHLYGAGVDSGTYDYFTEAINHKEHASRGDFTSSEDDNVLVQGISGDDGSIGFFGLAYYEENKDKLKLLPVDDGKPENGAGPIAPSLATVQDGTYQPLSRPLFVYVSTKSLDRPEIASFVKFYLDNAPKLTAEVGYIPLPADAYGRMQARVDAKKTGSVFGGKGSQVGVTLDVLLADPGAAPPTDAAPPADAAAPHVDGAAAPADATAGPAGAAPTGK